MRQGLLSMDTINQSQYQKLYQLSIDDPNRFWAEQAQHFITWFQPWQAVMTGSFATHDVRWFTQAQLNASYNCLDRHLPERAEQTAIIWEGDAPNESRHITYQALFDDVCRFANALKNLGIQKGDRVCIYLPMIPEAAISMLACARIGAIHSVVFGGFSADALKNRIQDADCKLVITADEGIRGGKLIPLKANTDAALSECPAVEQVIVVKRTGNPIQWHNKDTWYHDAIANVDTHCEAIAMDANDPLFILYTSGSTGKPKGILHSTGGYLTYAAITHKIIFNYQANDIYWCTADVGWITGHSYIVYGPLCNGATTLMFEGTPNYPTASRFWEVVDKHQVNIFYTAPTAIRALMREGEAPVKKTSRQSLKLLGSVGEPINPEVWHWYHEVVGDQRCDIVDTWWQTETGGIAISPIPHATTMRPGAASWPFFGIQPKIMNTTHEGQLIISKPWPGMMLTIYGDHQRFIDTYFSQYPGNYFTGDGAKCDADGYYWITGRVDDVINVSGHRIGTAEIESAIVEHHDIAEAAVVGMPHSIKGQGIYAYVTPKKSIQPTDELKQALIQQVRTTIGPIATPDIIQWASDLPKTRSGKIMRRILRKIATNELKQLGDTSTLANPEVVTELIEKHKLLAKH